MQSNINREAVLMAVITVVAIAAALLASSQVKSTSLLNATKYLGLQEDSVVVHNLYWYRSVQADYDSTSVLCTYGEMYIVDENGDSTDIEFEHMSYDNTDGSLSQINDSLTTKPMIMDQTDDISVYRSMAYRRTSDLQQNLGITDTVSWITQVIKRYGDVWLATIDSVCILPKDTGMYFPGFTGTSGLYSFDQLSIPASSIYGIGDGDSVYIRVIMSLTGSAENYSYIDGYSVNAKFSDYHYVGKRKPSKGNSYTKTFELSSYPNPATDHVMIDAFAQKEELAILKLVTLTG